MGLGILNLIGKHFLYQTVAELWYLLLCYPLWVEFDTICLEFLGLFMFTKFSYILYLQNKLINQNYFSNLYLNFMFKVEGCKFFLFKYPLLTFLDGRETEPPTPYSNFAQPIAWVWVNSIFDKQALMFWWLGLYVF